MSEPTFTTSFLAWLDEELAAGRTTAELSPANRAFLATLTAHPAAAAPARAPLAPPPPPTRQAPPAAAPPPPRPPAPVAVPAAPPPTGQAPAMELAAEPLPDLSQYDLAQLADLVRPCRRCKLCAGRTQTVFSDGNPHAEVMFIGEGPGAEEDAQGLPFVGKAGQLLTKMIFAMGYERHEVYIANIVKCRPPLNRQPEPDEAAACLPYLHRQIELVQPKVLVLLGAVPLCFLMQLQGITRWRGQWLDYRGIPVMPTFHPSYLLRVADKKRESWDDLKQVLRRLGRQPRPVTGAGPGSGG